MARNMTTTAEKQVLQNEGERERMRPDVIYRPNTDIYEDDGHVVLVTDMPGVTPDDVEITLEQQVLTIRGRTRHERPEGYRLVHAEYGEGEFERAFTITNAIDRDRIEASHRNGVLTVTLPKAETAKTRKIDVKAA